MKTFNLLFTTILALIILTGAIIVPLVALGVISPGLLICDQWIAQAEDIAEIRGNDLAIIISVSIVIAIGMITVLVFEALPRRGERRLLIMSTEQGVITINLNSIRLMANYVGTTVRNVHHIDHNIDNSPDGLIIKSNAVLTLGANLPQVGTELQNQIKEAIEAATTLIVSQVVVDTRYEPVKGKGLSVK